MLHSIPLYQYLDSQLYSMIGHGLSRMCEKAITCYGAKTAFRLRQDASVSQFGWSSTVWDNAKKGTLSGPGRHKGAEFLYLNRNDFLVELAAQRTGTCSFG